MRDAVLAGTGLAHPARCVPNAWFDERFGGDVGAWLERNLAIRQRYWLDEGESTSDLALAAAQQAMTAAGVGPQAIDLLIVATDTPDQPSPSTAAVVASRLGLRCGSFDLNSACSGFVTALDVGARFLRGDPSFRHVLVVGAYAMSRHLNPDDKKTVTLFADGAGAVVLRGEPGAGRGWRASELITDGQYWDWMGIYGGGARAPSTEASLASRAHQLVFAKKFPKEVNPATWSKMIPKVCERAGFAPEDVALFIFTQLNLGSIHETLDLLGLPRERAHTVMDRFAYTGSACIPMALHDALQHGRAGPGDRVVLVASGGGLTFAASAWQL
jgi:3-oxoacyl-[acyl-carrier-protein] synthase-3